LITDNYFFIVENQGYYTNIKMGGRNLKTQATEPGDMHSHRAETYIPATNSNGLADLQAYTSRVLNNASQWGFDNHKFKIKRHKLDDNTWQLTVINPKTLKTILQVEGHGDAIFAHEDKLAYMAEILMNRELTIKTPLTD